MGVRVPVLYTPNGYYGVNAAPSLRRTFFNAVEAALGGNGFTIHVSQSEDLFARTTLMLPATKCVIIPNGIDCTRFRPANSDERAELKRRWGMPAGAQVIGTIARYSDQKDPFTLYAAMREVLRVRPDAWFFHVGQGEFFDRISEMIVSWPEAVRMVRVAYLSDTAEAYRAMDVFTLSSRYEGLPISGLEAIASGLPLVLTRCPGNIDLDGLGLDQVRWTIQQDPNLMAREIIASVETASSRNNHREIAVRLFDQGVVWRRMFNCYQGLAAVASVL
jgi:glycosyltransferase EpsD